MESENKKESQQKVVDLSPLIENRRLVMEKLSEQQPTTFEKAKEMAERVRTRTASSSKKSQ